MSFVLRALRKVYGKTIGHPPAPVFTTDHLALRGQAAADAMYALLKKEAPCMIGRFGKVELDALVYHRQSQSKLTLYRNYITGVTKAYDFPESLQHRLENNAGFFPATEAALDQFAGLMHHHIQHLDVLGSWLPKEKQFADALANTTIVHLEDLNAYIHERPWTRALAGKKVLVIHPFVDSIQTQHKKHSLLFNNPEVLPEFELTTYKPIQSFAGNHENCGFKTWFDALESMQRDIAAIDFDIALIGCGAYGFPLAGFVKELGKKGVHLGGATQILFGIIGKRWEEEYDLSAHINTHWKRPYDHEKPPNFTKVEKGCYW